MKSRLFKSSAVLLFFTLAAGLFSYAYQVIAARRLTVEDLGNLNVSLSFFNVVMTAGIVLQYWAVLSPLSPDTLKRLTMSSWIAILASVGAGVYFYSGGGNPFWIFSAAVIPMVLLQYWIGRFQSLEIFAWMGIVNLLFAFFKTGMVLRASSVQDFAFGFFAAVVIVLFLAQFVPLPKKEHPPKPNYWKGIFLAALVGFASVMLPSIDLLNVRYVIGTNASGELARLQLFSKALYFAPMALLQVTLPHYVKALRGDTVENPLNDLRRMEYLGLGVSYLGALFFAFLGPTIGTWIFNIPGMSPVDILLACLGIIPFYGLLSCIQIEAAEEDWLSVLLLVAAIGISPVIASIVHWKSVHAYLIFAACLNTALGGLGMFMARRTLRFAGGW